MDRQDVYKLIDGEREYQNNLPHHSAEQDAQTSVAAWIIYMKQLLNTAEQEIYNMDEGAALEYVRKTTAVGVACMEHNETRPR